MRAGYIAFQAEEYRKAIDKMNMYVDRVLEALRANHIHEVKALE